MNRSPKISIVTPSMNQGQFLEECIDSILSQNYPNLEYIIMDGGSTDNSVEIIKKHEKYLTYWQSQADGGQYDAINEGFKKSSGEIMAWLNSDDIYHHQTLFKVAYIFTQHMHIEWITGRPTVLDKNGNLSFILYEFLPAYSRLKYLQKDYKNPWIQQESCFWRRTLWEKAGSRIYTDLAFAGDLELWARFFRFTQLYTADTLLGGFRQHENQKTKLFMDKYIEEAELILDDEIDLFQKGTCKDLLPMPDPVSISHNEIKSFIDNIYASTPYNIYKLSDDSDLVINFLIKRLIETGARLIDAEADRAARLEVIEKQHKEFAEKIDECEADRAARLEVINKQAEEAKTLQTHLAKRDAMIYELQNELNSLRRKLIIRHGL